MKKILCLFSMAFSFLLLDAQYKVTFILKEQTVFKHDSIYISGTFNNWDANANTNYLLHPYGEHIKSITLNLKAGVIKYKFHRGNWLSVEKYANGGEVSDRIVSINEDTTLTDSISRWRDQWIDENFYALAKEKEDSNRVKILTSTATSYSDIDFYNADSALYYAQRALQLQQKIMFTADSRIKTQPGYVNGMINLQVLIANLLHTLGNYPKALELRFENLKIAETQNNKSLLAFANWEICNEYDFMKDYRHALSYSKSADSILSTFNPGNKDDSAIKANQEWAAKFEMANAFYNLQMPDSALIYAKRLIAILSIIYRDSTVNGYFSHATNTLFGDIYAAKGDTKNAFSYYRLVVNNSGGPMNAWINEGMVKLFQKEGLTDSALIYAKRALKYYQTQKNEVQAYAQENPTYFIAKISPLIAQLYKANGQLDSAYKYLQLSVTLKDSLYSSDKVRQFQTLTFNEAARQQQQEQQRMEAQQQYESKLKMYGLITVIAGVLIFSFILYRNNKHKLQQQKTELEMQALRAQMNPHFIFNSLNSINHFILQNNKVQASEYLTKFSKLVRMILQNSQASSITLESELEALKLYLEIEALRFDYHFDYKISVPKDLDIEVLRVPPLIVQPYAENAIWHGLMHKEEKGKLDIEVSQEGESLFLKISDNGIGRKQATILASKSATKHKSMALRITAARIAFLQNANGIESPVTINDLVDPDGVGAGTVVIIKIPVIYD